MWQQSREIKIIKGGVFVLFLLISILSMVSFSTATDNQTYVPPNCGDGTCDYVIEDYKNCPADCENPCGNGQINTGENCQTCPQDVKCSSGHTCIEGSCVSNCGNGVCDGGECSFCAKDCNVGTCSNNGRCDEELGENCQNSPADCVCSTDKQCNIQRGDSRGCYAPECGDSYLDPGETQENCCLDAGCSSNKKCFMNKCVDCMKDSDCGNKKCSPKSLTCVECVKDNDCGFDFCHPFKEVCVECFNDTHCSEVAKWQDSFFCSPDFTKVMQKGTYIDGKCDPEASKCTGNKLETSRDYTDCLKKGLYCQNGKCGCDEGYSICKPLQNCVKIGELDKNKPCGCDFQCKSGYCKDNICIGLNPVFSCTKELIEVGEETSCTLSLDNNLNEEINANIAMNLGNGISISNVISGMHCSGNQCKISRTIAERNRDELTLEIRGESSNIALLSAEVKYLTKDGKERIVSDIKDIPLSITQCGDDICGKGESIDNCCKDCGCPESSLTKTYRCVSNRCKEKTSGLVKMVIFAFIVALIITLYFAIKKVGDKFKTAKKIVDEDEGRRDIVHTLNKIKKKINLNKPPTPKEMIEKLQDEFGIDSDKSLIREIYLEFLNELEKERGKKAKKYNPKNIKKFCSKCGVPTREGQDFCHKCGASIIKSSSSEIIKYCRKCGEPLNELHPFCPNCGNRTSSQSSASIKHETCMEEHRTDYRTHPTKGKKRRLIAILLALFLYPVAAGYIYLQKWKRVFISLVVIYGLLILAKDNAFSLITLYVLWTAYDCYKLAEKTS